MCGTTVPIQPEPPLHQTWAQMCEVNLRGSVTIRMALPPPPPSPACLSDVERHVGTPDSEGHLCGRLHTSVLQPAEDQVVEDAHGQTDGNAWGGEGGGDGWGQGCCEGVCGGGKLG